jgi:hypothetical protein
VTHLRERLARGAPGRAHVGPGAVVIDGDELFGGTGLDGDDRQRVGDHVVQFPGDPGPLLRDRALGERRGLRPLVGERERAHAEQAAGGPRAGDEEAQDPDLPHVGRPLVEAEREQREHRRDGGHSPGDGRAGGRHVQRDRERRHEQARERERAVVGARYQPRLHEERGDEPRVHGDRRLPAQEQRRRDRDGEGHPAAQDERLDQRPGEQDAGDDHVDPGGAAGRPRERDQGVHQPN